MAYPPNLLNSLRVVKGQSKKFQITVRRKNGGRASLPSGARMIFTAQRSGAVVFSKTTDDGSIKITDRVNGVATLELQVADTEMLEAGTSRYDLWIDFGGDPPQREPVIENAELFTTESVTVF